jgi:ribosomal protein L23
VTLATAGTQESTEITEIVFEVLTKTTKNHIKHAFSNLDM